MLRALKTLFALLASCNALSLKPATSILHQAGSGYAAVSTSHPLLTAGVTAGSILCAADLACQTFLEPNRTSIDARRTAALTIFGTWHYGVVAKSLYLLYDKLLGTALTLSVAVRKMIIDVYVHSPLLLIPSFYLITKMVMGRTLGDTLSQLRREWFTASFGTALFWTPLCTINFLYVPQHSRVVFVALLSFIHKTWLSWLSNREAAANAAGA